SRDAAMAECLEDRGYTVLRFASPDGWDALLDAYAYIFGPPTPRPAAQAPRPSFHAQQPAGGSEAAGLDLDLFDPRWHPLVRARDREWVVLPESAGDLLVLRPLGGAEDEVTGIYRPLEAVEPARFALPDPNAPGDYRSCRLLRDAVRLGFRSSAGPFRSFGRIAAEPRPYQLVPLLMALKLDPIRLLIADDVGIGKTIEAALIAREMLDRGDAQRLAVLCPPHLAEQWQYELWTKFHLHAELVLPSTVKRLERNCRLGQSLFERYPYVIVSTDFIKSDRRRDEFLRT